MSDVRCIECSKWSPRRCSEGMAKIGYGACDLHEAWLCFAGERLRDCTSHNQTDATTIQARRAFIERQKKA